MANPPWQIECRKDLVRRDTFTLLVNERIVKPGRLPEGLEGIVDYSWLTRSFSQGALRVELPLRGGGMKLYNFHTSYVSGDCHNFIYKR